MESDSLLQLKVIKPLKTENYYYPLHDLAFDGDNEEMKIQFSDHRTESELQITRKDNRGRTPLHYAALAENLEGGEACIKALVEFYQTLETVPDIDDFDYKITPKKQRTNKIPQQFQNLFHTKLPHIPQFHKTPQRHKSVIGHLRVKKDVAERTKKFINQKDKYRETALSLAAKNENPKIVEYLLLHSANVLSTCGIGNGKELTLECIYDNTPSAVVSLLDQSVTFDYGDKNKENVTLERTYILDLSAIVGNSESVGCRFTEAELLHSVNKKTHQSRNKILEHPLVQLFVTKKTEKMKYFFWSSLLFHVNTLIYLFYLFRYKKGRLLVQRRELCHMRVMLQYMLLLDCTKGVRYELTIDKIDSNTPFLYPAWFFAKWEPKYLENAEFIQDMAIWIGLYIWLAVDVYSDCCDCHKIAKNFTCKRYPFENWSRHENTNETELKELNRVFVASLKNNRTIFARPTIILLLSIVVLCKEIYKMAFLKLNYIGIKSLFVWAFLIILVLTGWPRRTDVNQFIRQFQLAAFGIVISGQIILHRVTKHTYLAVYIKVLIKQFERFLATLPLFFIIMLTFATSLGMLYPDVHLGTSESVYHFRDSLMRIFEAITASKVEWSTVYKDSSDHNFKISGLVMYGAFYVIIILLLFKMLLGFVVADTKRIQDEERVESISDDLEFIFIIESFLFSKLCNRFFNTCKCLGKFRELFDLSELNAETRNLKVKIAEKEIPQLLRKEIRQLASKNLLSSSKKTKEKLELPPSEPRRLSC